MTAFRSDMLPAAGTSADGTHTVRVFNDRGSFQAQQVEMQKVREQAQELGEPVIEALALTALGEAALKRDDDPVRAEARRRGARDPRRRGRPGSASSTRSPLRATSPPGTRDMEEVVLYMERAYALAMDAGRKDLQTIAAQVLAQTHIVRLELDEAELLLTRALELAGESGSVRARVGTTLSYGWFLAVKGELDAAETVFEEVRATAAELGMEPAVAAALMQARRAIARRQGRPQACGEAATARPCA